MNRLIDAKSPYLRHAAHQEIDWYPWGDEPFDRASKEDKPIFLSSGAVWCHWCHVMAKECFEDPEVVGILNEHFISIKLDRDERPDIDRRYQRAAAVSGAGGGWPLSVFLSTDRKPFFIGTYFPPTDAYGRPGFRTLLGTIADVYRNRRDELVAQADKVAGYLQMKEPSGGEIDKSLLDKAAGAILSQFDTKNGGFGTAPKFPMAGAMDFLFQRHALVPDGGLTRALRKTLEAMAKGGFHDQLAGGFHRYSTDEGWLVPHFEKMADDNSWLLKNYLDGYVVFGDDYFRQVAQGIVTFLTTVLADPQGGFYASQDADVTPDDEGGYFTWHEADFKRVLTDEENRVLSLHFLHEKGSLPHDPGRKVLFVTVEADEIARRLSLSFDRVTELIASAREKLLKERAGRQTPYVDTTLYTSLNGMCISSLLRAFRVFKDRKLEDMCIKSLARMTRENLAGKELLHCQNIPAMLDDFVFIVEAFVEAYEVTGVTQYLDMADELMETCLLKFWDEEQGGFFDTDREVLGVRLKGVEDIPHPSANSTGIMQMVRLSVLLDKGRYRDLAETALKAFAPAVTHMGVHGGYFFSALDAYFHMVKLTMGMPQSTPLTQAVLARLKPHSTIVYEEEATQTVIPCIGTTCYEPIENEAGLDRFLAETLREVAAKTV